MSKPSNTNLTTNLTNMGLKRSVLFLMERVSTPAYPKLNNIHAEITSARPVKSTRSPKNPPMSRGREERTAKSSKSLEEGMTFMPCGVAKIMPS
jgi:hypothetical protein